MLLRCDGRKEGFGRVRGMRNRRDYRLDFVFQVCSWNYLSLLPWTCIGSSDALILFYVIVDNNFRVFN